MKYRRAITTVFLLVLLAKPPVLAQGAGTEWDTLNQEFVKLYRAGKYDRAVVVAGKALQVAEENVGPDQPDVARDLENLAGLYRAMKRDEESEPLERCAVRLRAIQQ